MPRLEMRNKSEASLARNLCTKILLGAIRNGLAYIAQGGQPTTRTRQDATRCPVRYGAKSSPCVVREGGPKHVPDDTEQLPPLIATPRTATLRNWVREDRHVA